MSVVRARDPATLTWGDKVQLGYGTCDSGKKMIDDVISNSTQCSLETNVHLNSLGDLSDVA